MVSPVVRAFGAGFRIDSIHTITAMVVVRTVIAGRGSLARVQSISATSDTSMGS